MNNQTDFPSRIAAQPMPAAARHDLAGDFPAKDRANDSVSEEVGRLLAEESALYAITRDWRYDSGARTFIRVHALLDEQLAEIRVRLLKLSAHHEALGRRGSSGDGDPARPARAVADDGAREAHALRDLLHRHETLLGHLRTTQTMAAGRIRHVASIELLTDLIAAHEKDAFMLRALLWEVEHDTP